MSTTNRIIKNKKGDYSAPEWWQVILLILGLMAILFFIWLMIQANTSNRGIIQIIEGYLGIG
ncbi:hypothetical protein GF342_05045 [Candidatus Woesearchaeota archaeon]|nr:hypothetical protein [Candidatus Woesearchaeota archaeon]